MSDPNGSITVFLSLVCMLFLAVFSAITESARIQGACAHSASLTGAGLYSSLAWFEQNLLEEYEIFAVDGSCGAGWFGISKLERRLTDCLEKGASPAGPSVSGWLVDPWRLSLEKAEITAYTLLTDQRGEPFYQQAVAYMKENFATELISYLQTCQQDAQDAQRSGEAYEKARDRSDASMEAAAKQQKKRQQELQEAAEAAGTPVPTPSRRKNPLAILARLRFRNILTLVTGGAALSDGHASTLFLPSHFVGKAGTLGQERVHGSATDNLLFREYLLQHFANYRDAADAAPLAYQTEYLIAGKNSDQANLKSVANRLVALREGVNYLYCVREPSLNTQAGSLAFALTGFLGIPSITAATKHALLLGLSYGESLLDVRDLMAGGRIPLHKTEASWLLTPEALDALPALLDARHPARTEGLSYRDHLRLLLYLGSIRTQRMRALDLIQLSLRAMPGTKEFKAENCVTGLSVRTQWRIAPLFWRISAQVTGIRAGTLPVTQTGMLAYCP